MKKSILFFFAGVFAGLGAAVLSVAGISGLVQQNSAAAQFVEQVASRSSRPELKETEQFRSQDLPRLIEVLSKQDGFFERAYDLACAALPEGVRARVPAVYPSSMLRMNAAAVVGRWGKFAKPAVPELARLLQDDFADSNAALSLGQIGPDAEEAVPALILAVEQQRPMAATALGMLGRAATSARPVLQAAVDDGPEWQRAEAHLALHRIGANLSARN